MTKNGHICEFEVEESLNGFKSKNACKVTPTHNTIEMIKNKIGNNYPQMASKITYDEAFYPIIPKEKWEKVETWLKTGKVDGEKIENPFTAARKLGTSVGAMNEQVRVRDYNMHRKPEFWIKSTSI